MPKNPAIQKHSKITPIGSTRIAVSNLIYALSLKPHTVQDLVDYTGFNRKTVAFWIRALRRPLARTIYVADWWQSEVEMPAKPWIIYRYSPMYALGNKEDAPHPLTHLTEAELEELYDH